MNIPIKIEELRTENEKIPGKEYQIGMEIKRMKPYIDTGRMHEVSTFGWIKYLYNHTGKGINYSVVYEVMYDCQASEEHKKQFNNRCTELFTLGFRWSESSGAFNLPKIWSCYWEQVNKNLDWNGYIKAIKEAIKENHEKANTQTGIPA